MCRRHALLPCANAWPSCRLAPHSKHLTPPNSSCNAIARGIVLGSPCVASKSGNLVGTRNSPRFARCLPPAGATRPRAARPGDSRGLSLSGALRTGGSAQLGAEEPTVGGRCWVERGCWVGAALTLIRPPPEGSRRRPARAGCRGARLCAARLRGCLFNQEHRRGGP